MRLVFAGTPEAALPSLTALLGSEHDVVAVLTRPDAPAGRGRRLTPSPVGELAREAGVEVLTPKRPSEPEFLARLAELAPDCCPVVAYGALVPPVALAVPTHGWVNLHFSLLPAWRGAAPVQHAILAGDDITGATTFALEEGLDTGPVYGVLTEPVRPDDTAGALLDRLAQAGAGLLLATLDGIAAGDLRPRPQPSDGVSHAPKLNPDDVRVRWDALPIRIDRLLRAATPNPGGWTTFRGRRLGLGPLRHVPVDGAGGGEPAGPTEHAVDLAPGELSDLGRGGVAVGTGGGSVLLGDVKPEGKPRMAADAWVRGVRLSPGDRLE